MRILVAEDERDLLEITVKRLKAEGYGVDGCANGEDAAYYLEHTAYDLAILDIMMPGKDGLTILRELRRQGSSLPVLLLTALDAIGDRVEGLDAGADDYLSKPFSTSELLARVRAMLRRKDNYVPDLLRLGELVLNRSTYELSWGGQTQALSGREFQIMEMLLQRPNFIITTDEFMSHVWGWDSEVDVSVVWVHISNLRKKLAALKAPVAIRFVRNAGYTLEQEA